MTNFPLINFKVTNAEVSDNLKDLTEQKLQSLSKYISDASVTCDVEFEKTAPHQNGDVFRVETNLTVNGKFYRADATQGSFEKSVDEVRDALDKELRRSNAKHDTLLRRGSRKIKEMLRRGK